MRSLITILFVFFCFFLIISLFVFDPLPLFLVIFIAFLICFVCLSYYLSPFRGILTALCYSIFPFVIEYLLYKYNFVFAQSALLNYLSLESIDLSVTLNNLFMIFSVPLLFMSSLFFAQKIKLLVNIKTYHKTFLFITATLLLTITFLSFTENALNYRNAIKWLIVALIINFFIVRIVKFKPDTPDIFKELPIIIYLAIYGTNALKVLDNLQMGFAGFLTVTYLVLLYNEYKIRKIKFPF
jgi:hypothetical protein